MAEGYINIPKNGWTSYETLHTETYGALYGCINPQIGIGYIAWAGNNNTSISGLLSIAVPNNYKPINNFLVILRNGDNMEIRADGTVRLALTGQSWSGASAVYPLA